MLTARSTKCIRTIFASVMLLASPLNAESLPMASEIVATGVHFPEGTIFVGNTAPLPGAPASRERLLLGATADRSKIMVFRLD
jgi:hypothetical protein